MNTEQTRTELLRRRDEILAIVSKVGKHVEHRDEPLDRDAAERALELEDLDALFAIDRETRFELRQINDAIERIDIGHYGYCSECGVAIGSARLAAMPYADNCIACARRHDSAALGR